MTLIHITFKINSVFKLSQNAEDINVSIAFNPNYIGQYIYFKKGVVSR